MQSGQHGKTWMRSKKKKRRLSPFSFRRMNNLPSKSPLSRKTFSSSLSSSIPTHEEISHQILQQKSPSKSLQIFKWASALPSFTHNPSTYHSLIRSLISFNHLQEAHQILLSVPSPLKLHESTFISLIRAFGRAHQPQNAINLLNVFTLQNPPSTRILNSVLDVLIKEDIDLAREFFRKKMMGTRDECTFGILMKGLCWANRIAEAFKLLQLMKSSGFANPVIYNTLIHGLCRNGKVGRARSLMSEMAQVSDVTFHILISAYCGEDNLVQALVMLEKCFEAGFVPDKITVAKIVEVLCRHGRAMEALEMLERVEEKGGVVDVVCYNSLIKGFCRMEKPEVGKRVLKEMERKGCLPNVHTYNVVISGFCNSGKVDSAMDVFREMGVVAVSPSFETFDALIKGFCLNGRVGDGLKILDAMEAVKVWNKNRISPYNSILYGFYKENRSEEACEFLKRMESFFPRVVGRSLRILGFCKEGDFEEAKTIFNQMVVEGDIPSALVYVSLIEGMSKGKNVREAFELINEMVEKGYFPLVSTFNALIHGFCEEGNLIGASKLLEEMSGRGCCPNVGSYSPLINAFCRQGDFAKAYSLLLQMVEKAVAPDHSIWSCLLLHERFEMKTENKICDDTALCNICTIEDTDVGSRQVNPPRRPTT